MRGVRQVRAAWRNEGSLRGGGCVYSTETNKFKLVLRTSIYDWDIKRYVRFSKEESKQAVHKHSLYVLWREIFVSCDGRAACATGFPPAAVGGRRLERDVQEAEKAPEKALEEP